MFGPATAAEKREMDKRIAKQLGSRKPGSETLQQCLAAPGVVAEDMASRGRQQVAKPRADKLNWKGRLSSKLRGEARKNPAEKVGGV